MNKAKMQRIKVVLLLLYAMVFVIIAKLAYVQLIDGQDMKDRALSNRLKQISVKADRGVIYDRNGSALAISVEQESIWINPRTIRKAEDSEDPAKNKEDIIKSLAEVMEMDIEKIEELVAKEDADFVWVKRQADADKVQKLRELGLSGVGFVPEPKRVYPKGSLASHIIGFAGVDNQGLNGLELKYEEELKGTPGRLLMEYDNQSNAIPQALQEFIPAEAGYDLHLTIDETIQYIVEREISKVYLEQEAKGVTCVVMDVKTGGVVAMANMPNFDPNNYNAVESSVWNNFAVSGMYEPGSTFKILSASMFLDDGITRPDDNYYCSGEFKMGNDPIPIRCHNNNRHGAETFAQAVANSCNPVMAQLVLKLGSDAFYRYIEAFGLKEKTGIDVPGEAVGIVLSKERATIRDYGAMVIGQTNAFTPIQMAVAISAVANGGYLMTPYVVESITDENGNIVEKTQPHIVRQVISEKTSQEMRGILEQVVSAGTGKKGQIEGYKVAGKTGTAQKVVDGKYVSGVDIVSFAGFAPADNPQLACIVIVDEPKHEKAGGQVAGPVFSNIMSDALRYLNVPKTVVSKEVQQQNDTTAEKVTVPHFSPMNAMDAIKGFKDAGFNPVVQTQGEMMYTYLPPEGTVVDKGSKIMLYCKDPDETSGSVPDLTGKTIRECDRILSGLGYRLSAEGSGVARKQQPEAGTTLENGGVVYVTFTTTGQELQENEMQEPDEDTIDDLKKEDG